ncbi:MAG: 30S ribosomal protein S7 [Candidatus Aenigmarchaeota archaeon]|nr:30S ribosomal protein S7 [Candidatus Aenigmarchaeota archaeon]
MRNENMRGRNEGMRGKDQRGAAVERQSGRKFGERREFRKSFDRRPRRVEIKKREKTKFDLKLFGRWDSNVIVNDLSLRPYINLEPRLLPRSAGIHRGRFHKSKMHVAERLALHMMVPGHTGKRHRLTSGPLAGGLMNCLKAVEKALEIIEKKENKNPVEVLVRAIENAAVREEIISYQLGSIMARESVITAPQRRVDKTLRYFAQGTYRKSFHSKRGIEQALAEEILAAYHGSQDSTALREKERIEREAAGAR